MNKIWRCDLKYPCVKYCESENDKHLCGIRIKDKRNKMLKVATLFSGIGTPEQSLKHLQVEHETVFACEWDKYARITYLTNNQAPGNFYQDVKTLDATKYKDQVDILIAGFPCQAFSIAGKQLGFEDTRGTYFFDAAKAVRECNPKVFVFENVEGLISNDKPKTPNCLFKTYTWKENIESNQNVFFNHSFLLERIYDKKEKIHKYIFKDKIGVFADKVFHSKGYPSHFNKSYDGHKKGIGKTLYTMEKVMLDLGYKSIAWDVVNTKDYLVPQNRSRIYIVGFKDNVDFHFQEKQELKLRLKDMLEDFVDEKYLLNQDLVSKYLETGTASNHKGSQAGKVADENAETFWTVNAGTHGYSMGYVKTTVPNRIGNIFGDDKGTGFAGNIWDINSISPGLTTMQGGYRMPLIYIEKTPENIIEKVKPCNADDSCSIYIKEQNGNFSIKNIYSISNTEYRVEYSNSSIDMLNNEIDGEDYIWQYTKEYIEFAKQEIKRKPKSEMPKEFGELFDEMNKEKVSIANGVIGIENDEVRVREAVAKGFTLATEGDSINISVPSSKTRRGRVGKQVAQTLDTSCNQVVFFELENKDKKLIHNPLKGISGKGWHFEQNVYSENSFCTRALKASQGSGNIQKVITDKYIFRKLTPRECFRLQGFDDNFIFAPKMSDTQLYKQAGNGMSRNILDMIFTQIFTCYAKHIENKEN